jgi:hypothetical protein
MLNHCFYGTEEVMEVSHRGDRFWLLFRRPAMAFGAPVRVTGLGLANCGGRAWGWCGGRYAVWRAGESFRFRVSYPGRRARPDAVLITLDAGQAWRFAWHGTEPVESAVTTGAREDS